MIWEPFTASDSACTDTCAAGDGVFQSEEVTKAGMQRDGRGGRFSSARTQTKQQNLSVLHIHVSNEMSKINQNGCEKSAAASILFLAVFFLQLDDL